MDGEVREALDELWAFSPEARSLVVMEVADRIEELRIQKRPIFKPRQIPERIRPKVKEAIAGALAGVQGSDLGRKERLAEVLGALADAGPILVYPGYWLRLVQLTSADRYTPGQEFFWEISWQVGDIGAAQFAWDSTSILRGLPEEQQAMFYGELDKHEDRGWVSRKLIGGRNGRFLRITCFPHVNVGKNTKVRPVNDCTRGNRVSPPASNSQLSTSAAVGKLRGLLKPGMMVRQRDLDQAFLRMRVAVRDSEGNPVDLELKAPGRVYGSDRMVFGLSVGPLALTSAIAATREVVESLVSDDARAVGVVPVMDDFTFVGWREAVEEYDATILEAWALTGFEATKTWDWNAAESTKWLGHGWKWDSVAGQLTLVRSQVEGDMYDVTKRGTYELAGAVHAVTESLTETTALGHANTARKLVGAYAAWDSPVDIEVGRATLHHLREMLRLWKEAAEEIVPLTSTISRLVVESDASLSGLAFVMLDPEERIVDW